MSLRITHISRRRLHFLFNRAFYSVNQNTTKVFCFFKEANHNNIRRYSTATFKELANDEVSEEKHVSSRTILSKTKDNLAIDDLFSEINSSLEKTGRILSKKVYKIFDLFQEGKTENLNSVHGLYLIRSCGYMLDEYPTKRVEFAKKVWNKCTELGLPFDVRHFNSLIKIYLESGSTFNPAEFLASMEDQNIQPNKSTYLLLMKGYCKVGNLNGASEILEFMKLKQFPIDQDVFVTLIEGHLLNKDYEGAESILNAMRSANLPVSNDVNSLFLCAHASNNNESEIQHFLDSGKASYLSNKSYFKIIEALASSGNDKYIDRILPLLELPPKSSIHEFVNASLKFIHKDMIDVGYKLLKCVPPNVNDDWNIYCFVVYVQQLIKSEKPVSKIIEICSEVLKKGNQNILLNIAKAAADYGKIDHTLNTFKELQNKGFPLRIPVFHSLFEHMKNIKDEGQYSNDDIWKILNTMHDLGIPCSYTTYLNHVYPVLNILDPKEMISKIKKTGQFERIAVDSLFTHYCNHGAFDLALELTNLVPVTVTQRSVFQSIVNFQSPENLTNLRVLKYVLENVEGFEDKDVVQAKYLAELILKYNKLYKKMLKNQDMLGPLYFNYRVIDLCREYLRRANPYLVGEVKDLKVKTVENKVMTVEEENKCIQFLKEKDLSYQLFLNDRLFYHMKEKNMKRIEELVALYEKEYTYTPRLLSQLIQTYCSIGDLQKSKELLAKLERDFPTFKLDFEKATFYASTLIKYAEYEETLKFLKNNLQEPHIGNKETLSRHVRNFLTTVSETCNVEFFNEILNIMTPISEHLDSTEVLLEPRINIHLFRNDLTAAIDEYRNIIMNHHIPLRLNTILKKCIMLDDLSLLKKAVDVTSCYANHTLAFTELAVAFIETGRSDRAAKTLQELGERVNFNVLGDICLKLKERKLLNLEKFVFIATGSLPLSVFQKNTLFLWLFEAYRERNNHQKALEMCNLLKQKEFKISPELENCIKSILKKEYVPVTNKPVSPEKPMEDVDLSKVECIQSFLTHLQNADVTQALNEVKSMKVGYIRALPLNSFSELFDLCVKNNKLKELSTNSQTMPWIIENDYDIVKPCLVKYAESGEVEYLKYVASVMPDFCLRSIGFNTWLAKAYITSNRHSELLSELEKYNSLKKHMFSTFAFDQLLKYPEYEDRLLNIAAETYESMKYEVPIAVVWCHYFLQENFEKADSLHSNFSIAFEKIDGKILKHIRDSENMDLANRYLQIISNADVRDRSKIRAYGTVLDVLVLKGDYDAASKIIEQCPSNLHPLLSQHFKSTLVTLSSALQRENKPVNFKVPTVEGEASSV